PADKITICHATKSVKNPYVEITISMNGLHGHGPADDSRHHAGSWKDIIPAPKDGCPSTVQTGQTAGTQNQAGTTGSGTENQQGVAGVQGSADSNPQNPAEAGVLGARASGGSAPKSGVLGARASGRAPAAAVAARRTARTGSLPFTGTQLAFVLIAAAVALLGGFALRRVLARQS